MLNKFTSFSSHRLSKHFSCNHQHQKILLDLKTPRVAYCFWRVSLDWTWQHTIFDTNPDEVSRENVLVNTKQHRDAYRINPWFRKAATTRFVDSLRNQPNWIRVDAEWCFRVIGDWSEALWYQTENSFLIVVPWYRNIIFMTNSDHWCSFIVTDWLHLPIHGSENIYHYIKWCRRLYYTSHY